MEEGNEKSVTENLVKRNMTTGQFELDLTEAIELNSEFLDMFVDNTIEFLNTLKSETLLNQDLRFRITNIPSFLKSPISSLRAKNIDKLVFVSGILKKIIQPISRRTSAKFECPSCLPKGTLVCTPNGLTPIELVKDVFAANKDLGIITCKARVIKTRKKKIWRINNEISCSGEHKWFVYRNGITKVIQTKHLKTNDILYKYEIMSDMQERTQPTKTNLLGRMQTQILQFIPSRWRTNKTGQSADNQIVSAGKIFNPNSRNTSDFSQTNQEKTYQIQNTIKDSFRTMQDKYFGVGKEALEIPKGHSELLLSAWKILWAKEEQQILSKVGKGRKDNVLRNLPEKRNVNCSSQRLKPSQQQVIELTSPLQLVPYKVALVNKETTATQMYDLIVPFYNNFILNNGVISHNCGTVLNVWQDGYKLKEPLHCSCGRRGGFKKISEDLIDIQTMEIEENIDEIGSRQPQKIAIILENELTAPDNNKFQVGNKIEILGVLKQTPKYIERDDSEKNICDYVISVIQINPIESYNDDVIISSEEMEKIQEIAKNDPLKKLSESIAPGLYGLETIKKASILFLTKGVTKLNNGERRRGEIHILIVGDPGCVDKDTEFFTEDGWKNISEYKSGDLVMQYNSDGTAELVDPIRYIKKKCEKFYRILTKNLDQKITPDHRVIYKSRQGNLQEQLAEEVYKRHIKNLTGFRGNFITTFSPKIKGWLNMSDEDIRLTIAIHADGSYRKGMNTNYCRVNIKKEYKKIRLRELLKANDIIYRERKLATGFSVFTFYAKRKTKTFGQEWFNCSLAQMKIIKEEIFNWDGNRKNVYRTCDKDSADFIQYILTSLGYCTSCHKYKSKKRKSIDYIVRMCSNKTISISKRPNRDYKKRIMFKEKSLDGFSYCFQVPSGMFIIRRNGKISITGNCGKSQLIQGIKQRVYNCRIADGKDASKAGIVCTVSKDQYTGKWGIEAGDIVLANKGYLLLDEADKLPQSDRQALHRPMEQGIVDVSKAGVHSSMSAETSILAVANPKMGMFDETIPIIKQIDFNPTLLSRFDLVFVLRDKPDELSDNKRADKILDVHFGGSESEIPIELIKKYFLYCSKLKPKLTKESVDKIKKIYTKLRAMSDLDQKRVGMPINNRHLEGLIRMSEASAKIRLSETVDESDVDIAEDLFMNSLGDIGFNKETGTIDLSGMSTSIKTGKKNKYLAVIELIRELEKSNGKLLSKKLIVPYIQKIMSMSYSEVDKILETLRQEGQIYEPKTNHYSLMD